MYPGYLSQRILPYSYLNSENYRLLVSLVAKFHLVSITLQFNYNPSCISQNRQSKKHFNSSFIPLRIRFHRSDTRWFGGDLRRSRAHQHFAGPLFRRVRSMCLMYGNPNVANNVGLICRLSICSDSGVVYRTAADWLLTLFWLVSVLCAAFF